MRSRTIGRLNPDATGRMASSSRRCWSLVPIGRKCMDTIRVVLVDDHEVVRRGVSDLLSLEDDIEVAGEAATFAEAMARIPALKPDVAVLDVRLPDGNGVVLCRELRSKMP